MASIGVDEERELAWRLTSVTSVYMPVLGRGVAEVGLGMHLRNAKSNKTFPPERLLNILYVHESGYLASGEKHYSDDECPLQMKWVEKTKLALASHSLAS